MKLYTTPSCGPCKRVKALIAAEGYDVTIIDSFSKFPPDIRSVPTLEVDGKYIVGDTPIIKKLKEENESNHKQPNPI